MVMIMSKSISCEDTWSYISAPKSVGNVFGIYGPMGIGKTTIKDGLSKVLQTTI